MHGRLPYELIKPDSQLRSLLRSIALRKIVSSKSNFQIQLQIQWFQFCNPFLSHLYRFSPIPIETMRLRYWTGWDCKIASIRSFASRQWIRTFRNRLALMSFRLFWNHHWTPWKSPLMLPMSILPVRYAEKQIFFSLLILSELTAIF